MNSRTAYRISLIFGLIVLALAIVSSFQPAPPVCGNLKAGYAPIIAFELVRSVSDLHAIFGNAPGACRSAIVARMDAINALDSYLFIPCYGAFLIFFFVGRLSKGRSLAQGAIALTVIACIADYAENFSLFHLSAEPDIPVWIPALIGATETKWVALGMAGAAGIPLLWSGWLGWLALILCGIGLLASLLTLPAAAAVGPYLSNAIALGWLLFLAVDIRGSIGSSRGAA